MGVLTSIDVCTRALVMIGATPITSFADGTTEAITAATLYDDCVADMLGRHRWRFAAMQLQCSRIADPPPLARWAASYQLPADMVVLHALTVQDNVIPYDRYGQLAYAEEYGDNPVIADYTGRPPEPDWPPTFVMAVEFQLASLFAVPVGHQEGLAQKFEERAIRHLAMARNIDSQSQSTRKLRTDLFVRTRRSTGAF